MAGADLAFAAFTVGMIALFSLGAWRTGVLLRDWTPPGNLLLSWPDNLLRIALIAACFAVGAAWGPGPEALGWGFDRLPRDIAVGAGAGLALALALNGAGQLAVARWGPDVASTRLIRCMLPAHRGEWPGVLLALLPAALLEELVFRSLPLGGLGWLISPWLLLWPLALLFGLLHWPQGRLGVVLTAAAAAALSLLFLLTGSLWAALVAHYVVNVHQVVAARRQGLQPLRTSPPASPLTGEGSQAPPSL
jgi:membrane protease YdiL (CAAX protease family)